jgi:hypothetical protein
VPHTAGISEMQMKTYNIPNPRPVCFLFDFWKFSVKAILWFALDYFIVRYTVVSSKESWKNNQQSTNWIWVTTRLTGEWKPITVGRWVSRCTVWGASTRPMLYHSTKLLPPELAGPTLSWTTSILWRVFTTYHLDLLTIVPDLILSVCFREVSPEKLQEYENEVRAEGMTTLFHC